MKRTLRIVTAGRLVSRKRIDLLLQAIRLLRDDGYDSVLTVFGEGPMRESFEALAKALDIESQVTFMGFTHQWYTVAATSDVFVHLSDEEGFCIVVAEAMMVGLPVIANPVGGIRDYSQDGNTAYHLQTLNPREVASVIRECMANSPVRQAIGRNAAATIRRSYSYEAVKVAYGSILY